ncbi:MAG: hypothetical protein A2487_02190 [Candidatus Raymondbacteria bacterium RifOxyC12_full_50_8]|nr:MAG: hypothetical protein A2350_12515 [Candidatus Raymondbacteria bacterium RifOxyB12_full_50_8]OGK06387.1 MAG: hypothetical protein A2487_02190 [Candidatus Raymondbacteria bacterium RifOxyC12_full_50_8]
MKETFFSILVALGQLFVGRDLSTDVTLMGKVAFFSKDSIYVAAAIQNGHNKHMDDYVMSGLPLRLRYIMEIWAIDKKTEIINQRYFFHEIEYNPAEKKYRCIRSIPGDTLKTDKIDQCWRVFFNTENIGFNAHKLKGRSFYFSLRAFMEKTYIVPMEKTFDPMIFWGDVIPMYEGTPLNMETLPVRR